MMRPEASAGLPWLIEPVPATVAPAGTMEFHPLNAELAPDEPVSWQQRLGAWAVHTTKKALHKATVDAVVATQVLMGMPPSLASKDPFVTVLSQTGHCAETATYGLLQVPGLGNNQISSYAAINTRTIMKDEPGAEEACHAWFSYGGELNKYKNADVLYEYLQQNHLKRIIIFAHSFGLIATVDMINQMKQDHPDIEVDIAIVAFSSPTSAEDAQLMQNIVSKMLAGGLGLIPSQLQEPVIQMLTALTTFAQGDKVPDAHTMEDIRKNATNTPPLLLIQESARLQEGLSELEDQDNKVPVTIIFAMDDGVVNAEQAIPNIPKRLGKAVLALQVIAVTYSDKRMQDHANLWWLDNMKANVDPVRKAIEFSTEQFEAMDYERRIARIGNTMNRPPGVNQPV